jgi:hypothetical protein
MPTKTKGRLIETPNERSFSEELPEWFTAIDPPYSVTVTLEGTKPYLFNRYNGDLEDPETAQTRRVKKSPPIESRLTVDSEGFLAAPTEQIRMAIIKAGTNYRNPRAKAGSLATVLREGLVSESDLCSFGVKDWEYEDTRRARHASSFVTKVRPGLLAGWTLTAQIGVMLPQYIIPRVLHQCLVDAGRIGGIGDARTLGFGRFIPTRFEVMDPTA